MTNVQKNIAIKSQQTSLAEKLYKIFSRAKVNAQILDGEFQNDTFDSAVYILGDGSDIDADEAQIQSLNQQLESGNLQHAFIWKAQKDAYNEAQSALVSKYLSRSLTYSREHFDIRFAEDVLKTISVVKEAQTKAGETDISLFYNSLDENLGKNTGEMLKDIFSINDIPIDLSDTNTLVDAHYQTALNSRFLVILYQQEKEWAELFTQEIWKNIGGAAAKIPILLVGSDELPISELSIPLVKCAHANEGLLALEIKVQLDSFTTNE